jgi:hypothetical protein
MASVGGMNAQAGQRFLVEWYGAELAAAPPAGTAARLSEAAERERDESSTQVGLVLTLAAPADDVLYGVFVAETAEAVLRACRGASWPADRITADVRAHIPTTAETRENPVSRCGPEAIT